MVTQENTKEGDTSPSEVESNPKKVFAKGYGLSTGLSGQPNIFTLDARHAGFGDFDVVIKGASQATIEYLEEEEALYKIKYFVALPGDYRIEIKYDQQHIPGSPFLAKIMEAATSLPEVDEKSISTRNSTGAVSVDSFSTSNDVSEDEELSVKNLSVSAEVTYPSGRVVQGQLIKRNGKVTVKFAREEIGIYTVTVSHKKTGKLMPGFPYQVQVSTQKHNTTFIASGPGLRRAAVNETNCFSIFTPKGINLNDLCMAAVGYNCIKMSVSQNDVKSIEVLYEIKSPEGYVFYIHENGEEISSSPFHVETVRNLKQEERNAETLRTLTVTLWHGKDTCSNMGISLFAPNGQLIPHKLIHKGRHLLQLRFLPCMNGEYLLKLNFNNQKNDTEKFKLFVKNLSTKSKAFHIHGDGLHLASINTPSKIYINTSLPMSKSFSAEFHGTDKMDIKQSRTKEDEYCVTYTPKRSGNYIVSLKYDGFHIGDSPYHINVVDGKLALPPAGNFTSAMLTTTKDCNAYGDGLSTAFAGIPTKFTVDALNAGSGSLMVGFDGNQASTEIVCKHVGNCVYEVQYKVMKAGFYKINVLWAGLHIQGSPFDIKVTDENNNR